MAKILSRLILSDETQASSFVCSGLLSLYTMPHRIRWYTSPPFLSAFLSNKDHADSMLLVQFGVSELSKQVAAQLELHRIQIPISLTIPFVPDLSSSTTCSHKCSLVHSPICASSSSLRVNLWFEGRVVVRV